MLVLNALRHQRLGHQPHEAYFSADSNCAQRLTASEVGAFASSSPVRLVGLGAQRLTASEVGA